MKNGIKVLGLVILAISAGIFGSWLFHKNKPLKQEIVQTVYPPTNKISSSALNSDLNFVLASEKSTPSVVFIKVESEYQRRSPFWFFDFDPFGNIGKVSSTGSGVIISADGYIVTNNHVIKNADKIDVVLNENKRTYKAEVIGVDPSSDLALLKINATELPAIQFEDSDKTSIGEWVLAVGNPFNLTSTVTAGIVSAKGRNINIVDNNFPIESFIQTDAAINPGNSGGALVNLDGNLVGVNTAIASKTGSYVGYGFAIPSNIVSKIIQDLREHGQVQRAFLGVDVADITGDMEDQLSASSGVLINRLNGNHPEVENVLEAGDIVQTLNGNQVNSKSAYDELLAYRRPGEIVEIGIIRDGKEMKKDVRLVNSEGGYGVLKKESIFDKSLGAEFEKISRIEEKLYKIEYGVKVVSVKNGKIRKMNIPEGFIFMSVNQKKFTEAKDLIEYLNEVSGQVRIDGIMPNGRRQIMSFYVY